MAYIKLNENAHLGATKKWYFDDDSVDESFDFMYHHRDGFMYSQSHPKGPKGNYIDGGGWVMRKLETHVGRGDAGNVYRLGRPVPAYTGGFIVNGHLDTHPWGYPGRGSIEDVSSRRELLWEIGAELYDAMKPTKPIYQAASAVLELKDFWNPLKQRTKAMYRKFTRERDKMIRKNSRLLHQKGADWYLAMELGWIPLLSDLVNYHDALSKVDDRLQQLVGGQGKPIKRRTNPAVRTETDEYSSYGTFSHGSVMAPLLVSQCYHDAGGQWKYTAKQVTKTWAECEFNYQLPGGNQGTAEWQGAMKSALMGHQVTPSTVWNLMPWSFVVDYFVDVGTLLDNATDGVAAGMLSSRFYLMRECTITEETEAGMYVYGSQTGAPNIVSGTRKTVDTVKLRILGDPFGVGPSSDLSPRQLAILTALGYAR